MKFGNLKSVEVTAGPGQRSPVNNLLSPLRFIDATFVYLGSGQPLQTAANRASQATNLITGKLIFYQNSICFSKNCKRVIENNMIEIRLSFLETIFIKFWMLVTFL